MSITETQRETLTAWLNKDSQVQAIADVTRDFPTYKKPPRPKSDTEAQALADLLRTVVECRQVAAAHSKVMLAPREAQVAFIKDWFQDEVIHPLDALERHLRVACKVWVKRQSETVRNEQLRAVRRLENKYDALIARAEKAEADGKPSAAKFYAQARDLMMTLPEAAPTNATLEGLQKRRSVKWEVIDESVVPETYRRIDTEAINEKVQALGVDAARLIPGIEVTEDTQVAIT